MIDGNAHRNFKKPEGGKEITLYGRESSRYHTHLPQTPAQTHFPPKCVVS